MIKVGRFYREKIIEFLKKEAESSGAFLFVNFKGINSNQLNILRRDLKEKEGRLVITKNSLLQRAFPDWREELGKILTSETGVVYIYSDEVGVIKTLFRFRKENENLEIKAGFLKDKFIEKEDLEELSKLPSREVILGLTLNCIASPLIGLVNSLQGIILKLVWAVEEIRKKKESVVQS
ncbi:MAG: 50S ribosomal protein L10 [Candidatus Duberdicusella sinuisediminis]|nr:MAG: 50S ribosomal protein L10 [Candidatus Omnitrophota bacterium]